MNGPVIALLSQCWAACRPGQRVRVVAAHVGDEQRRRERKAVRRDDRDDVQRDDDGVGAHARPDAPPPPLENSPDFALEREDERAAIAAALRSGLRAGQRARRDRQERAARGGARERRARCCAPAAPSSSARSRSAASSSCSRTSRCPYSGAAAHAAGAFSAGGEPDHAVLHGLYWLTAGLGPLAIVVDDAHWLDRRRCAGSPTWSTASPTCRWRSLLAARSDEPDELLTRIALHPSTTTLHAEAAHAGGGRASSRARSAPRRSTRPPAGTRSTCTRCSPSRGRHAAPGGRVDRAAPGGAAARVPEARPRDRRRRQRRDDRRPAGRPRRPRGGRGRRGARARPTSCAATASPTRSSSRPSTPRSRPPSAPSCTPRPRASSAAPSGSPRT